MTSRHLGNRLARVHFCDQAPPIISTTPHARRLAEHRQSVEASISVRLRFDGDSRAAESLLPRRETELARWVKSQPSAWGSASASHSFVASRLDSLEVYGSHAAAVKNRR
jgi:hypothetical protein